MLKSQVSQHWKSAQTWIVVLQSLLELQVCVQSVLQCAPLVPLGNPPQSSEEPHLFQQHCGLLGGFGGTGAGVGVGGGTGLGGTGLGGDGGVGGMGLGGGAGLGAGVGECAVWAPSATIVCAKPGAPEVSSGQPAYD